MTKVKSTRSHFIHLVRVLTISTLISNQFAWATTTSISYYDYEGPVGTGTVQSNAHPKVMAVRICRQLAEIINTNYWE